MRQFVTILLLIFYLPSLQYAQWSTLTRAKSTQTNTQEYVSETEYYRFLQRGYPPSKLDAPLFNSTCCQWTIPVIIDTSSPNLQAQTHAALAVDDSGNLVTAWMDTRSGGDNQIVVERSTNKGQTWLRSVPYSYAYLRVVRDIAFDHAGNLWLLWTSSTGEFQPYFLNLSKSSDNGQTFTTLFTAREYAGAFFESKLAIDRLNNVFILWPDQQFKLTRFASGNISQRTDANIPNDTLRVDFWCSLDVGREANTYATWTGVRNLGPGQDRYKVYCSTSLDTGQTFTVTTRVDTTELINTFSAQRYPESALDTNGVLYISYGRQVHINDLSLAIATSVDYGATFRQPIIVLELGFNTDPSACVDSRNGADFLWSGDGGAYFSRSTNSGQTFSTPQLIVAGNPDIGSDHLGSLFAVFAGSLRIKFARTNVVVAVEEKEQLPSAIELLQNYPNPFNPTTTISFALPSESHVSLKLYDLLGREVMSLVNEPMTAGYHQTTVDGSTLATGVYLYRMTAGSFSSTKKLLLMK